MFGSVSLEVAIGTIFIFLLVSIICSAVREGIESILKTRAAYLDHGIRELLKDRKGEGLAKALYEHPLIYGLFTGEYKARTKGGKEPPALARGGQLPAYIPAKNFAIAIMDIAARGAATDEVSAHADSPIISLASVRANIANLGNSYVQRGVLAALDSAQDDFNLAQKNIEDWFNSSMDRISGWYKRSTNWVLFVIGAFVAFGMNINVITIADYLYKHDAERTAVVARAEEAAKDSSFVSRRYDKAKEDIQDLPLPIGWSRGWGVVKHDGDAGYRTSWNLIWGPILGWLIMALAATLGAPFWFDLLNKIMVIRSTVKPHEKSPEEGSEDRQSKPEMTSSMFVQPTLARPATNSATGSVLPFEKPALRDEASSIDGCGISTDVLTKDEDLPPSIGGIVQQNL